MVTLKPRDCKSLANEAEIIPLPSEEVTPPVTKIYFVFGKTETVYVCAKVIINPENREFKKINSQNI